MLNLHANPVALRRRKKSTSVNRKKSNPDLKALILAAGLGTRLRPLTAGIPKALVSINGITLLEIVIRKLAREGFSDIIINVHHHAGQVIEFLNRQQFPGVNISISDESGQLLDTGGAILKARWFLDGQEPFLVHNVDNISDISLQTLLTNHKEKGGLATLSVSDRLTKRYFLFDNGLKLRGWTDTSTGEIRWAGVTAKQAQRLAFNGIHIIEPEIFNLMKEDGKFSIIDLYLRLAGHHFIFGHVQPGRTWFDLGKPDQLEIVASYLKDHPENISDL
jgi:N-acetyl-alpha-D-muramate 1-phosphate uridylyltransferase